MKLARITLLLLCILSAVALLLRPSERPALLAASPPTAAYDMVLEKSELVAPAQESTTREAAIPELKPEKNPAELLAEFTAERFPDRKARRAEPPKFRLSLRGQVIATDEEGVEWDELNGQLDLSASWDGGSEDYAILFTDGHWQKVLESSESIRELTVERLVAGGRSQKILSPFGDFPVPESGEFIVHARLAKPATLRVVDKATGRDLSGLSLVRLPDDYWEESMHPGGDWEARAIARDLESPIALDKLARQLPRVGYPTSQGSAHFHLGAEGYVWRLQRIDVRSGGETLVELESAARVEVAVTGVEETAQAKLRVLSSDPKEVLAEVTLHRDGNYAIDGLDEGEVFVSAEIGHVRKEPLILDQTTVSLRSGRTSNVRLVLPAPPVAAYASASGTVRIPKAWNGYHRYVVAELQDLPLEGFDPYQVYSAEQIESQSPDFDDYRWEMPRLQVGTYVFRLNNLGLRKELVLPPSGLDGLHWTAPAPVQVTVQTLDRKTGEALHPAMVIWGIHPEDTFQQFIGDWPHYDESAQAFVFTAPETEIHILLRDWNITPQEVTLNLADGNRHHVLHLEPACGIYLSLECDGQAVAFPEGWRALPTAEPAPDSCSYSSFKGLKRTVSFCRPGAYSFEIPKVSGYRQTQPLHILVETGNFATHTVLLERE